MKAAVIFTGSGPILILTSHDNFDDPDLVSRMAAKGIDKFIANEISFSIVRQWYGTTLDRVLTETMQDDELRILDVDGQHIFCHLRLSDLGPGVQCERAIVGSQ